MIKRLKKSCWVAKCDECGEDLFGMEYIPHYETKQELMEAIENDNIDKQDGKYFCSTECWRKHFKI